MMPRTLTYAEAVEVLVTRRVVPNQDAVTLDQVAIYAARHGWSVSTERTSSHLAHRRWRATVTARQIPNGYISGTQGYGATEDDALVIAVAGMVRQRARRG